MTTDNSTEGSGEFAKIVTTGISTDPKVVSRTKREKIWFYILGTSGLVSIALLLGVTLTLVIYGIDWIINPARFWEIISKDSWYPDDEKGKGVYGARAMIWGTFLVGIPALIFSIFWGLSVAIFLSEYVPPKVTRAVQPIFEYIAAIPSVIFGLIAHVYISGFLRDNVAIPLGYSSGRGPLLASITLAFMASPIIVSISIDALQSAPRGQRNAVRAFGATKYEELRAVALPHAKLTIFASVMLAFGRILGETMVVLIVLGNSPVIESKFPKGFFRPAYTLTSAIANEIGDAQLDSDEFNVLFVLAFVLLMISFMVIWISNLITTGNKTFFRIMSVFWWPFGRITGVIANIVQKFTKRVDLTEEQISTRIKVRTAKNYAFAAILGVISIFNIVIVFYLIFKLLNEGSAYLNTNFWQFLTDYPTFTLLYKGKYGIYSAIIGSVAIIIIASVIALPISTGAGIYLSEFSQENRLTQLTRMAIINISAVPSIVVGLFVYGLFSIQFNWGQGLLPGGLALGIIMIPIVTTNTIEALRNSPMDHKISSLALGGTNWESVRYHRVPYAFPSIITGYILAIARVIGEVAPLLFIAAAFRFSNSPYPTRVTNEAVRVLPFEIYYNLLFSTWDDAVLWAFATSIVLLGFVAILSVIAYISRILLRRRYEYNGSI